MFLLTTETVAFGAPRLHIPVHTAPGAPEWRGGNGIGYHEENFPHDATC
jgi:hypothetical protein